MRRPWPLLLALAVCGCSRAHYRVAADRETYAAVAEHVIGPAHDPGRLDLIPPPASRLHDPTDPDHPPKPPDDPTAGLFMDCPDGRRGSHKWDRDGHGDVIAFPGWEGNLPVGADGKLRLDAARAVDLALLHSREYQTTLEDVYLTALALTLNRFEFDLRWFFRQGVTYTRFGAGSRPFETNTLDVSSQLGFNKTFAAGGQLLVDLANSFVWEFTGRQYRVNSNLLINFVQPLLRNGGRQFRLEALTQAEREVLYAVRDLVRFRKQFWADVTTLGGGYLDLLLQQQAIRNSRANLASQEQNLRLHEELFRIRGAVSVVAVDQAFQQYQSARQDVLSAENALANALDDYKVRLGLPPRVPVELDDAPLERFQLADPRLDRLRERAEEFQQGRYAEIDDLPSLESVRASFARLRELVKQAPEVVALVEGEVRRWGESLERPGGADETRERARKAFEQFREDLSQLKKDLAAGDDRLARAAGGLAEGRRKEDWEALVKETRGFLELLAQAQTIQAQTRVGLIELPAVDWTEERAVGFARENRLDFQNVRGRVTDAWRRVAVTANQLKAELNVVASANLASDGDAKTPFDFSAQASRYTAAVQFDGPLNRLAERNAYRASQVAYQRARRDWMLLADRIEQALRRDLRGLELERLRFEIAKQSLVSAARQVEAARVELRNQRDPTNTASTLAVQNALSNLLQARNDLAGSYISYEQQRVRLLLDLEALQLDERGVPTHEHPTPTAAPDPRPGVVTYPPRS